MIKEIKDRIFKFKAKNDISQYRLLLDCAEEFIGKYSNGVENEDELDLGILLIRELTTLNYIGSLKEYENDYNLQNEIIMKRIKTFKLCIPQSHKRLRGLTEMLVGMKENELG